MPALVVQPPLLWPFLLPGLFSGSGLIIGSLIRFMLDKRISSGMRGFLVVGVPLAVFNIISLIICYSEKVTIVNRNGFYFLFLPFAATIAVAASYLSYEVLFKKKRLMEI